MASVAFAQQSVQISTVLHESGRYHHTVTAGEVAFQVTYLGIDDSREIYNANASLLVFEDFFSELAGERGFVESGTFNITHETKDESGSQVTLQLIKNVVSYEAGGVTDATMGYVDGNDLFLNFEDLFVGDGDVLRITSSTFVFSTESAALPAVATEYFAVWLTNAEGELLSYTPTTSPDGNVLLGYDFADDLNLASTAAIEVHESLSASDFATGEGLISTINTGASALGSTLNAEGNPFGSDHPASFGGSMSSLGFADMDDAKNLDAAITAGDYVTLTVTPDGGHYANLLDFTFRMKVDSLSGGAQYWSLFTSQEGFVSGQELASGEVLGAGSFENFAVSLATDAYTYLTEPITFRLYLYGGSNDLDTGTYLDKVIVKGEVQPVPSYIAGYDFDDGEGNATYAGVSHYDVTISDFQVGSGLKRTVSTGANAVASDLDAEGQVFGTSNAISFGGAQTQFGFTDFNDNYNLAGALSANDYMFFEVEPSAYSALDMISFSFIHKINQNYNGAEHWALFSSIDGFASANSIAIGDATGNYTETAVVVDLSAEQFQGVRVPVQFRLYIHGGNASSSSATTFDKVILRGNVVDAPYYEFKGYEKWAWDHRIFGADKDVNNAALDDDGMSNFEEFVLMGDPRSKDRRAVRPRLLAPGEINDTIQRRAFSFYRNSESVDESTQVVEYSNDLLEWHALPVTGDAVDPRVKVSQISSGVEEVTVEALPEFEDEGKAVYFRLVIQPN